MTREEKDLPPGLVVIPTGPDICMFVCLFVYIKVHTMSYQCQVYNIVIQYLGPLGCDHYNKSSNMSLYEVFTILVHVFPGSDIYQRILRGFSCCSCGKCCLEAGFSYRGLRT